MLQASTVLSLVPEFDVTVYIVLDDFGKQGCIYRETDEADADVDTVVDNILTGQYNNPVRVVAFIADEKDGSLSSFIRGDQQHIAGPSAVAAKVHRAGRSPFGKLGNGKLARRVEPP